MWKPENFFKIYHSQNRAGNCKKCPLPWSRGKEFGEDDKCKRITCVNKNYFV